MGCHCWLCVVCLAVAYCAVRFAVALFPPLWEASRRLFRKRRDLKDFGKWAVVTGATDGIGREIAVQLAKRGLSLLLIARNQDKLIATKNEIKSTGGDGCEVETLVVDFSDPALDYSKAVAPTLAALKERGELGILVNNVGLGYPACQYFTELSSEFIDSLVSVNLRSTLQMTRLVLPAMTARRCGAVICIGSGASQVPSDPLNTAYAGLKSAVEGFCRSLQVECAKQNVVIQCQTPLLIVSKLSKIRTASITVPTAKRYATDAVLAMETVSPGDHPTTCPHLVHHLLLAVLGLLPLTLWNSFRLSQTLELRRRFIKKQERSASSETSTNSESRAARKDD